MIFIGEVTTKKGRKHFVATNDLADFPNPKGIWYPTADVPTEFQLYFCYADNHQFIVIARNKRECEKLATERLNKSYIIYFMFGIDAVHNLAPTFRREKDQKLMRRKYTPKILHWFIEDENAENESYYLSLT